MRGKIRFADPAELGGEALGFGGAVDEYGDPVERPKERHPYNYSSFVTWRKPGTERPGTPAVYSDRLYQWDHEKFDRLCKKHFGDIAQVFYSRSPEAVEAFLRDYLENPAIELELIMEGCNQATGFPVWVFYYRKTA